MADKVYSPQSADELNIIGSMYHQQGRADIARLHYDAALLIEPDNISALQNLSAALLTGSLIPAAISIAKRACVLDKKNVHTRINLAAAYLASGKFAQARDIVKECIASGHDMVSAFWHNLGLCHANCGDLELAQECYNRSLALDPDSDMVQSDRALNMLGLGWIQPALVEYQVRWKKLHQCAIWNLGIPEWKDENLNRKSIIVHSEQGFGDGIMLVRFVKNLEERYPAVKITLAVPYQLQALFQQLGYPVLDWEDKELSASGFDYHIPMLSLMGKVIHHPSQIKSAPYLTAKPSPELGPRGYRIGICWASGDHSFALAWRRRYCPLPLFFPLSEIPGVRLVSLQKGNPENDILNLGAESFIYNPMPRVQDFQGTAEVISGLDLVISVDSAITHLAGAMGKESIMLGPYVDCWRWKWGEDGQPWYNNLTKYKQQVYGEWAEPVNKAIHYTKHQILQDKEAA